MRTKFQAPFGTLLRRLARSRPVTACLGAALATVLGVSTGAMSALDRRLQDAWFGLSERQPSGEVVVVTLDAAASRHGDGLRLPRAQLAELVARLDAAGAARILVDLGLTGPTLPADDAALEGVLRRLGPGRAALTASAIMEGTGPGRRWARTRVEERFAAVSGTAASDLALDTDMVLRRAGLAGVGLPPLASTAAWLAGAAEGAWGLREPWPIDFGIDVRGVPVLDGLGVLEGRFDPAQVGAKRVIVASFSSALGHTIHVPRFGSLRRSEITALSAETVLQGRHLRPLDPGLALLGAVLLCALVTPWAMRLGALVGAGAVAGLGLCVFGWGAQAQIASGLVVPATPFLLALLAAFFAAQIATHPRLERVRDALGGLAGRFDLRLAQALDMTGEALVTFTPSGQVLSMNAAARRLFDGQAGAAEMSVADLLGAQAGALIDATRTSQPGRVEAVVASGPEGHRHLDLTVSAVAAEAGGWIGVASIRDVTDQRDQLDRLRRMALQDPLTGLANRPAFERALDEAVRGSDAGPCAVLLCDLDGFKGVNDSQGHHVGDALLCEVGRRLRAGVGPHDTVARLGGDEFALVLRGEAAASSPAARIVALQLVEAVRRPVLVEGLTVEVGISIGVALGPGPGATPEGLVRAADAAMYQAKRLRIGVALAETAKAA